MNTMRSSFGGSIYDAHRNSEVDLALAIMCALVRPGECVTHRTIAEVTGMSHGGSYMIELRALKKLRNRLSYTSRVGKEIL